MSNNKLAQVPPLLPPSFFKQVGLAAAGGGVLLFLSGGVAAPSVSASLSAVGFAAANTVSYVAPTLGAWLGYTSASAAAAVGSTVTAGAAGTAGSVGAFSAVSGAAGAGVAGYKMTRRTAGVRSFFLFSERQERGQEIILVLIRGGVCGIDAEPKL